MVKVKEKNVCMQMYRTASSVNALRHKGSSCDLIIWRQTAPCECAKCGKKKKKFSFWSV